MRHYLNNTLGFSGGEKRVRHLMSLLGLVPIYQTPQQQILSQTIKSFRIYFEVDDGAL